MLKISEGSYKGYRFQFAYSSTTELKLLILSFQNTVDLVFCESIYNNCNKRKRPLDLVQGNVAKDIENYSDWLGRFPT